MNAYLCLLERETDGFSAIVPDFENSIVVSGDTREEVLELAREALALYLNELGDFPVARFKTLKSVPKALLEDFAHPMTELIEPAMMNPVSLEVSRIIERSGLTLTEIAKRMRTSVAALVRMKNPFYWGHSLKTLREFGEATGTSLEVKFKSARKHQLSNDMPMTL
jgi:antitoxin HicB